MNTTAPDAPDPPRLDEPPLVGRVRRSPAWLTLGVVTLLLWVLAVGANGTRTASIRGPWDATVTLPDGTERTTVITLPGSFARGDIPWGARVRARRTVHLSGSGQALWIGRPRYAVEARWDGQVVGRVGDPSRSGAFGASSLFVPLPPSDTGPHVLELDLRGGYGHGGVYGPIVVGPVARVHVEALASEAQRLALALGATLLAALPSIVATRGAWRPSSMLFGSFAAAFGATSLLQTDLFASVFPHLEPTLRLFQVASAWTGAVGVAFATSFVQGRPRLLEVAAGVLVFGITVGALLLPDGYLPGVELTGQILLVLCLVLALGRVREGFLRQVPGASLVAVGGIAAAVLIPIELALSHGVLFATALATPAGLICLVCCGGALVLRDARTSEQHERLMRGSPDVLITVDVQGLIRYANPAAEGALLTRLPPGSRRLLDFVIERDHPIVRRHLASTRPTADRVEFGSIHGRVYESLATPIARHRLMLTLRDVTDRRDLDRAMYQAARVEIAGTLLGGVAHDFNNTLQLILAHIEMLRMKIDAPWAHERFHAMEDAVDRASSLTKRMLTVARGSGTELGSVRLAEVVKDTVDLLSPNWPREVTLSTALPADLPPVLGAAGELAQVMLNLLVNARDALSGRPGHVRIAARPFLTTGGARGVALMVEDDGPGIPAARKEEVFQPFVSTKARGTGLGLAVARQILRDHQGRLWLEDRPEGGARFLLAVWHADAVDERDAPLPEGRQIVLVEDEVVLLDDYRYALETAGYEVAAFSSSTEAARHLETHRPSLLVTDLTMPGMSGIALATLCGYLHPDVPVLLVSAHISNDAARALTVEWYPLHKPARASLLVATVGRVLRRWERRRAGNDDVMRISQVFPDLSELNARYLGFDAPTSAPDTVLLPRPR